LDSLGAGQIAGTHAGLDRCTQQCNRHPPVLRLPDAFNGASDLALALALFDGVTLVADVFAAAEADLDLDDALFEVDLDL